MKRVTSALLPVLLIAGLFFDGCAHQASHDGSGHGSTMGFDYQPNPPLAEKIRVPLNVVVLPFEDATPEWKQKGFFPPTIRFNLAKTYDQNNRSPFISPERWARDFSQELTASGVFATVRYAEGGTDPRGDILIHGKVMSASRTTFGSYDYAAQFQAFRYSDGKALWGKTVSRQLSSMSGDRVVVTQTLWRSMFGEALADLVKELEAKWSEWGSIQGEPPASGTGESVEEILRKINKH